MGRMRSAVYVGVLTVPATETAEIDVVYMLRDILPDERFRLHSMIVSLRHSMDIGDQASITMAKNITPIPGVTSGAVVVTHGVVARFEHIGTAAAGVMTGENWMVPFPSPFDFDEDDALNMRLQGTNSAATSQEVYGIITMQYEAG